MAAVHREEAAGREAVAILVVEVEARAAVLLVEVRRAADAVRRRGLERREPPIP
jgi:hypothetical protein